MSNVHNSENTDKKRYPNSGTLSRNRRKKKPNHADCTGSLSIDCPRCGKPSEYWLSAWTKEGQRGKFLSIAAEPKDEPESALDEPADDDIPF